MDKAPLFGLFGAKIGRKTGSLVSLPQNIATDS